LLQTPVSVARWEGKEKGNQFDEEIRQWEKKWAEIKGKE
jgi:hypothetical protein